jgi:hypothetical protein
MESLTLPLSGKVVRIPTTGQDWELYTSTMACGRAARALTAALKKALREVDKAAKLGLKPTEGGLERVMDKFLSPVMSKYAAFGAYDTEPRSHAFSALDRAVKDL